MHFGCILNILQIIWSFYTSRKFCLKCYAWITLKKHLLCHLCSEWIIISVLSQFYPRIQIAVSDLDVTFIWEICSYGRWRYFYKTGFLKHMVCSAPQGIGMPSRQEFLPRDGWIMNETSLAAVFGWVILSNGASSVSEGLLMPHLTSVIWWMGLGGLGFRFGLLWALNLRNFEIFIWSAVASFTYSFLLSPAVTLFGESNRTLQKSK